MLVPTRCRGCMLEVWVFWELYVNCEKREHRTMSIRGEKGQSLVEFALVLPVLVLLVIGMIEFGRVLNVWLIVGNGAREGARYAAVGLSEAKVIQKVKDF